MRSCTLIIGAAMLLGISSTNVAAQTSCPEGSTTAPGFITLPAVNLDPSQISIISQQRNDLERAGKRWTYSTDFDTPICISLKEWTAFPADLIDPNDGEAINLDITFAGGAKLTLADPADTDFYEEYVGGDKNNEVIEVKIRGNNAPSNLTHVMHLTFEGDPSTDLSGWNPIPNQGLGVGVTRIGFNNTIGGGVANEISRITDVGRTYTDNADAISFDGLTVLFDYYQARSTADPLYAYDNTVFVATGIEIILEAGDIEIVNGQTEVAIDIKPGSYPNSINLGSGGATPVAVLGSLDLDVNEIDPDTLTLGTSGIKTVGKTDRLLCSVDDVSGDFGADPKGLPDGYDDLVCHFITMEIVPEEEGDTQATLAGALYDETPIAGSDTVNIVP